MRKPNPGEEFPAMRGRLMRARIFTIEQGGVTHWWENVSTEPVKALVVDIVAAE